jgi:type VI protein secretion system component VasK
MSLLLAWLPFGYRFLTSLPGVAAVAIVVWFISGWKHSWNASAEYAARAKTAVEQVRRFDNALLSQAKANHARDLEANEREAAEREARIADYARAARSRKSEATRSPACVLGRTICTSLPNCRSGVRGG